MEKILTIPIKPGLPAGTKIVFLEEGDQGPSKISGKSPYDRSDTSWPTINVRTIPCAMLKSRVKSVPRVDAADVIFLTEDRPHETFRREGSDLHTTIDIFLREALIGTMVMLRTIDDRILRIPITSIVMYVMYRYRIGSDRIDLTLIRSGFAHSASFRIIPQARLHEARAGRRHALHRGS